MFRSTPIVAGVIVSVGLAGPILGDDTGPDLAVLSPQAVHVPQRLLPLVHAEPVQKELGLTGKALDRFLPELREIDAIWWPARNRPSDERRAITAKLETRLLKSLRAVIDAPAIGRLRELELQAQGTRCLARDDLATYLNLTEEQSATFQETFAETDQFAAKDAKASEPNSEALQQAKEQELSLVKETLTPAQTQQLAAALGETFDVAGLERIYPLAPELIDSGHWTTGEPVSLEDLRGRVVLLHFYAYQCHNCHANFPIYKRWDRALAEQGVAVIGIQTPETEAERDVAKVKQAARKRGFEFPVLIDLDNKNWDAWGNTMWPTVYIIDQQGYIRGWWQGELQWQGATGDKAIEQRVAKLLEESP